MANWSGLAALGEMAKGAGKYYGTLSSEQRKNERLAQARAERVADRAEERGHQLEDRESNREWQIEQTDGSRDYAAEKLAEERAYQAQQSKLERSQSMEDAEMKHTNAMDLQRLKDGPGGSSSDKTASQVTHETRTQQAQVAYAELDAIMERYDPGSAQGGWDQTMVGGLTNFMASEDGKQYQSAAGRVKEAFLRAATGAAAPETENKAYINMFIPQFGDGPETKAAKKAAMMEQIRIMQSAYDEGIPQDVRLAQFEQNAQQMIEKHKLGELSAADSAATEDAKFKPYQDERGNWVKTPPQEDTAGETIDDILNFYK